MLAVRHADDGDDVGRPSWAASRTCRGIGVGSSSVSSGHETAGSSSRDVARLVGVKVGVKVGVRVGVRVAVKVAVKVAVDGPGPANRGSLAVPSTSDVTQREALVSSPAALVVSGR